MGIEPGFIVTSKRGRNNVDVVIMKKAVLFAQIVLDRECKCQGKLQSFCFEAAELLRCNIAERRLALYPRRRRAFWRRCDIDPDGTREIAYLISANEP